MTYNRLYVFIRQIWTLGFQPDLEESNRDRVGLPTRFFAVIALHLRRLEKS